MTRFKFSQRLLVSGGEGILDIPHPTILNFITPKSDVIGKDNAISFFEQAWGVKPQGIVLPVTAPDGLLYEIEGLGLSLSEFAVVREDFQLSNILSVAVEYAKLGYDIYLSIDPTLPFVRTDALHIKDISNDGSQQVCIGNPRTRELIALILGTGALQIIEALEKNQTQGKLAGIVVDACNLWPMGANNQGRLELTCFCESCTQYFKNSSNANLVQQFRTFPNPWNLVLDGRGSGISFIDNLPDTISPEEIIGLSKQKGFDDLFDPRDDVSLLPFARDLQAYIRTRHDQTVGALADLFDQILVGLEMTKDDLKCIVITEGSYYDWTSGLQLDRLDQDPKDSPFSEIWFNATSSDMKLTRMPFRSYMWRRARYFIDAFFNTVASAADATKRNTTRIARFTESELRDLLSKRLGSALASQGDVGKIALSALPELQQPGTAGEESQRVGFVGVALTEKIGTELIDKLKIAPGQAESALSEAGSPQLLELLKLLGQKAAE